MAVAPSTPDPARALLHRWFVQYNPAYLVSATLVLAGIWLLSRESAREASVLGQLAVAALAEVYALTLIGGAAFLVRVEQRRPAVMLALLAVLYQADLTMHVETCAYLGAVGWAAAAAWLALFAIKLRLLAWALRLTPSRSAWLVALLGGLALASLPLVLRRVSADDGAAVVAVAVLGVGALGACTARRVEGALGWDVRGRRALRATWATWAVLGLVHAAYWAFTHRLPLAPIAAAVALTAALRATRDRAVLGAVGATVAAAAAVAPGSLWVIAWMSAGALVIRARRSPLLPAAVPPTPPAEPYRAAAASTDPTAEPAPLGFGPSAHAHGLLVAAMALAYVGVWTSGWSGGPWPEHHLGLDLTLLAVAVAGALRSRRLLPLAPPALAAVHLGASRGVVSAPDTSGEWGALCVTIGFAVLLATLWRTRVRVRAH